MTDHGTVYLLHFDRPYRHAKHYLGWTDHLDERLEAHRCGQGARLMTVIHGAGIGFQLARTWPGSRTRERQLKRTGGRSRKCPICQNRPLARPRDREMVYVRELPGAEPHTKEDTP